MITIEGIKSCILRNNFFYSRHARNEMLREELGSIHDNEVIYALETGAIIESYPDDKPYPSVLVLGFTDAKRPLHIVCAVESMENLCIVVTVYEPDPALWVDFTRRQNT